MDAKWKEIRENLRNTLDSGTFRLWVAPLKAEINANTLNVFAPNAYMCAWVSKKLLEPLQKAAASVVGCGWQQVRVVTQVSEAEPEPKPASSAEVLARVMPQRASSQGQLPMPAPVFAHNQQWDYSFEEFVTGPSNKLAVAAAQDVCQAGQVHTLFVNAGAGLGKTHLVRAAGHAISASGSPLRVFYLTADQFASGYVAAMRARDLESFKNRLCSVDVLLLEDVHFLQRKMAMQEMILAIVKQLQAKGARVIFTSSFAPRQLEKMDPQLISYFCSGILANMERPDLDMRKEILQRKARHFQVALPDAVCDLLSRRLSSDVRQLEACLENIIFKARLLNSGMSIELAEDTISQFADSAGTLDIEGIVKMVCESFGVSEEQLRSRSRRQEFVQGRNTVFYLARKHTGMSLEEIGCIFNRRHSTVMRSITQVEEELAKESRTGRQIARAVELIERRSGLAARVRA